MSNNYYPPQFDLEHLTDTCSECDAPIEEGKQVCSEACYVSSMR